MGKKKKCQETDYQDIESLKRQLNRARAKGDFKEVGNVLNQLGAAYRDRKDYEEALEKHEEEVRITKKHSPNDKIGLAIAYRGKAEVYIEMNDQSNALPMVREYLKLSIEMNDLVEQQRAHITLGRVYLGLSSKNDNDESDNSFKTKALERAEKEFRTARDLLNNEKIRSQQSESNLMDMKCGAFVNIAIVLEMKGQLEESKQFYLKAIEIGRKHSLYEHVYRSCLNLCEIYTKLEYYNDARLSADEAARAGKALGNKKMEFDGRIVEAKVYYFLDEIGAAVKLLKKLRKQLLQTNELEANKEEINEINPILKCGVRIRKLEDTLDFTDSNDFKKRKKLFECLADTYVKLGTYSSAILFYHKAVECAEMANIENPELAKLYFSLAETYNDKNDHFNALKYFEKEICLHKDNPIEAFKTQTSITSTMENSGISVDEVIDSHEKALQLAKSCGCPKKEIIALKNKANYFKTVNLVDEANEILNQCKEIQKLYNLTDENESDSQEVQCDSDGDSIDLDNLTSDDEELTDEEQQENNASSKKRKIRLNEKGETPLHIASQKGDIKTVRRLIRDGHNVNARDCAGWTPLHEACNFGAIEVVEALLENKANVNDPGGEFCDKTTPLHDAAANGQVEVMSVVLKYNPNVLAKNSKGNFILDELIAWKIRRLSEISVLDDDTLQKYRNMKNELRNRMEKAGYTYTKKDEIRANRKRRDRSSSPKWMLLRGRRGAPPIPALSVIDDFDPDNADAAVDLYSATMQKLRGKSTRKTSNNDLDMPEDEEIDQSQSDSPEREALIAASQDIGDDWLENDVGINGKNNVKRKRDPMDDVRLRNRKPKRKRNVQRNDIARVNHFADNSDNASSPSRTEDVDEEIISNDLSRNNFDFCSNSKDRVSNSSSSSPRIFDNSFDEPTIIENTFSYENDAPVNGNHASPEILITSDSDETDFRARDHRHLTRRKRIVQSRLPFKVVETANGSSNAEKRENHHNLVPEQNSTTSSMNLPKALRLKVCIADKTLLVPVKQEDLTNTIDWLCEECAKRYSESAGLTPVLSLSTLDGALLTGSDIIHVVLSGTEVELVANVTSIDLPRLPVRFKNTVSKLTNCQYDEGIDLALEICQSSNILNLSEFSLQIQLGQIIFQALKYQYELKELILSECVLQDEGIKQLSAIIPTLPSLVKLDLSCNGITSDGLQVFAESFRQKPDIQVNRSSTGLVSLNLSFNPLGNSAGAHLTDLLLQLPELKTLLIADCDFNVRLLAESRISDALKKMQLDELDVSYNPLGTTGMGLILQSMSPDRLICKSCLSNDSL